MAGTEPDTHETARRLRALARVSSGAWAAVIFAASALPGSHIPGRFGYLAHLLEFGVLGALLARALHDDGDRAGSQAVAFALASAYAVTDEVHQAFVPGRCVDALDWLVDTAGALAAIAAVALVPAMTRRLRRQ